MSRQSVAKAHQKIQELSWEPQYHEPVSQYGTDYTFHKAQKKDPLKQVLRSYFPMQLPDAGREGQPGVRRAGQRHPRQHELRDGDLGSVFVDAINTIRAAVASAEIGDDPFTLTESSVDISFAVTAEGTISLGVEGGLANELTHTLTFGLVPV